MMLVNPKIRLVFGMLWTLLGNAVSSIAALLSAAFLARLLSPEEIGTYFLIFSMVSIAAVISQFGLSRSTVRLVAESIARNQSSSPRDVIRSVFTIALTSTCIVSVFLYFYGIDFIKNTIINSEDISQLKLIIVIWMILIVARALTTESFRGLHNIKLATMYGDPLTRTILASLLFFLWIFYRESNLQTVAIIAAVSVGFVAILGLNALYKRISQYPKRVSMAYSQILIVSWPLFVVTLTNISLTQSDIWIIGAFKNESEVALYGAATRLALLIGLSFNIVNAVIPPLIVELNKKDSKRELESLVRAAGTFSMLPSLAILLVFIFFGADVMGIIYGDFYRSGSLLLLILSFGQLVNVCTGSSGVILSMTGHQKILMIIIACSAVMMLTGGIIAAPYYGSTGVAAATAVSITIANLVAVVMVKKKVGIWSYADIRVIKMENLKKIIQLLKKRFVK